MKEIPQQGSISDTFLPRLITRIHREGFDGVLRVNTLTSIKAVYFKGGEIASAASNAEGDRLQSILLQDGRITEPQLKMAKSRVSSGTSLGKSLIEMGFLTPSELLQAARRQVKQILASCMTSQEGSFQIEPGPLPPEVTVLGLTTRRLIFDSLMQASERQWIVREMRSMESVYRPTSEIDSGLQALSLEPTMQQVALGINGRQSLRDLSNATSLDDFAVSKVVLGLEILGLVETVGEPAAATTAAPSSRTIPIESEESQRVAELTPPEIVAAVPGADGVTESASEMPGPTDQSAPLEDRLIPATGEEFEIHPTPSAPDPASTEPPPIPTHDLPAFAAEADDGVEWSVDPRTGEREHLGPIEVTFDGHVRSMRDAPINFRRLLGYAAVAMVLIVVVFLYVARRASQGDSPGPVDAPVADLRPTTGKADRPQPEREPATLRPAPSEEPAAQKPAVEKPVAVPQVAPPRVTTPPEKKPPRPPEPPQVTERSEPAPAEPAEMASIGAGTPPVIGSDFREDSRYAAAQRHFDDGDFQLAARLFQELAAGEEAGYYSLQLMIACESRSLESARARSGDDALLYILPFSLQGRSCYRTMWGVYPSQQAARDAGDSLPDAWSDTGVKPIAISMTRLRPPNR